MRDMDGNLIRVGDTVGFKADYEEYGTVKAIKHGYVDIAVYDSNTGDTEVVSVPANRVWKED